MEVSLRGFERRFPARVAKCLPHSTDRLCPPTLETRLGGRAEAWPYLRRLGDPVLKGSGALALLGEGWG